MTRKQIAKKYDSEAVANSIVEAKLSDPEIKKQQVKPHPDMPDNDEL